MQDMCKSLAEVKPEQVVVHPARQVAKCWPPLEHGYSKTEPAVVSIQIRICGTAPVESLGDKFVKLAERVPRPEFVE